MPGVVFFCEKMRCWMFSSSFSKYVLLRILRKPWRILFLSMMFSLFIVLANCSAVLSVGCTFDDEDCSVKVLIASESVKSGCKGQGRQFHFIRWLFFKLKIAKLWTLWIFPPPTVVCCGLDSAVVGWAVTERLWLGVWDFSLYCHQHLWNHCLESL